MAARYSASVRVSTPTATVTMSNALAMATSAPIKIWFAGSLSIFSDELAVDLDQIKEKIAECRLPGAELIQRKGDAFELQAVYEIDDDFQDLHGGMFGDLEDQPFGDGGVLFQPAI